MESRQSRITAIRASGILGEYDYSVSFPSVDDAGRMRLIYAPNGRGKTNFLRAVTAALTPIPDSFQALVEIPFTKLTIDFANGGSISLSRNDLDVGEFTAIATPESGEGAAEIVVDPSEFSARVYRRMWETRRDLSTYSDTVVSLSPGAVFIGDDRLVSATADDHRESVVRELSVHSGPRRKIGSITQLLETVERMLTQRAIVGLSRESEHTGIYSQITQTTLEGSSRILAMEARADLERQIGTILRDGTPLERYGLLSMRQVRDIAKQISMVRANHQRLPAVYTVLAPYFDSLQDQITALAPAQDLINTYVTSVNRFLDKKKLRFSASNGIDLEGRDKASLNPENLSSGERHLLLLLSRAVLATVDRPLVVVDEPEISLGIEWQRDLLPELLRCSASGEVQFLVASHSLQVMNAVNREDIVRPEESHG